MVRLSSEQEHADAASPHARRPRHAASRADRARSGDHRRLRARATRCAWSSTACRSRCSGSSSATVTATTRSRGSSRSTKSRSGRSPTGGERRNRAVRDGSGADRPVRRGRLPRDRRTVRRRLGGDASSSSHICSSVAALRRAPARRSGLRDRASSASIARPRSASARPSARHLGVAARIPAPGPQHTGEVEHAEEDQCPLGAARQLDRGAVGDRNEERGRAPRRPS